MVRLSDVASGRENNFNLLRMIAAFSVLISHSVVMLTGDASIEPLLRTFGGTLGGFAVDVFFISSGFLVTASLLARKSPREFLRARALRIYPGLWAMLIILALIVGPLMTSLPLAAYFSDFSLYKYIARTGTLFLTNGSILPGVFGDNPLAFAANGSLWTLPREVWLYVGLLLLWCTIARFFGGSLVVFKKSVLLIALVGLLAHCLTRDSGWSYGYVISTGRFFYDFFIGATLYVYREWIWLSARWAMVVVGLLMLAVTVGGKDVFFYAWLLALPYLLLCFVYLPKGWLLYYNQLGDYSYGVYIYAWPVKQVLIALLPGITLAGLLLSASLITLLLAVLSWHLVEKRALRFKASPPVAESAASVQLAGAKA